MTETVGDYVLRRLRDWGVELVFGYPGDGINGLISAFGEADNEPKFVQIPTRGDVGFPSCGVRQIQWCGGCVHGHLRPRGHPPAQRPVRRQTRPRPRRRHRRAGRQQRDGRQLPAGDRSPSAAGRTSPPSTSWRSTSHKQLPNAPRPRLPHRASHAGSPTALIIPADLQEQRVQSRRSTHSSGASPVRRAHRGR